MGQSPVAAVAAAAAAATATVARGCRGPTFYNDKVKAAATTQRHRRRLSCVPRKRPARNKHKKYAKSPLKRRMRRAERKRFFSCRCSTARAGLTRTHTQTHTRATRIDFDRAVMSAQTATDTRSTSHNSRASSTLSASQLASALVHRSIDPNDERPTIISDIYFIHRPSCASNHRCIAEYTHTYTLAQFGGAIALVACVRFSHDQVH